MRIGIEVRDGLAKKVAFMLRPVGRSQMREIRTVLPRKGK